jgi:hypothetical protein
MQTSLLSLSHFIHIWYLDWPWSEHTHIIPISWMVDFCERVIALFMFVWPYIRSHILCTQLVICLLSHFIHIRYLVIYACSDHGQPRYQIWIKCDKRQMTRCVHKMCERTHGQTNMKRAITACAYYTDFTDGWFLREL